MSFSIDYFNRTSSGSNGKAPMHYTYASSGDTLATIKASGYFDVLINQLEINDVIDVTGSDGSQFVRVTSVTTNVTVEAFASTSSATVMYSGEHTTVGGAAAEAITIAGVLSTDYVFIQLKNEGATPVIVVAAAPSADTVTVTFSADPSNDHVIYYQVLRAL